MLVYSGSHSDYFYSGSHSDYFYSGSHSDYFFNSLGGIDLSWGEYALKARIPFDRPVRMNWEVTYLLEFVRGVTYFGIQEG